ncbi:MAG: 3-dehydroquinate synthase [Bacteroidales bacterium]|jgi:3-dehydroquinate synthase|nr:3-dehydroquinate synthase [Bacteroidales bacterium]
MKQLTIDSSIGTSLILVGESIENIHKYVPKNKKIVIISDDTVISLYKNRFPQSDVLITVPQGEAHKTLHSVERIYEQLLDAECDRSAFILAIGGGIICDMAGFVAATFMRGVEFGFVSTTLLSQVDASVGGKNGVNFKGFKNFIGTFCLPKFVICELSMLKTLSHKELLSGMAEVIKHGAIADPDLFTYIEKNTQKVLRYDEDALERFVSDSVIIKSDIVNLDAREGGMRRLLNFGHTFGHAIEKITKIPHGHAISVGMVYAARLSEKIGGLPQSDVDRLVSLLDLIGLPTKTDVNADELYAAMKGDKKREGSGVHFVLLSEIGKAYIEKISFETLEQYINDLC